VSESTARQRLARGRRLLEKRVPRELLTIFPFSLDLPAVAEIETVRISGSTVAMANAVRPALTMAAIVIGSFVTIKLAVDTPTPRSMTAELASGRRMAGLRPVGTRGSSVASSLGSQPSTSASVAGTLATSMRLRPARERAARPRPAPRDRATRLRSLDRDPALDLALLDEILPLRTSRPPADLDPERIAVAARRSTAPIAYRTFFQPHTDSTDPDVRARSDGSGAGGGAEAAAPRRVGKLHF
jgi:hypothetical protein